MRINALKIKVDGNTSTCLKQYEIGLNYAYKTVLWKVDFGGVYNIYNIHFYSQFLLIVQE